MSSIKTAKGKKRARDEDIVDEEDVMSSSSSDQTLASTPPLKAAPPVKKPKRAVTRKCPICDEDIPVRLLAAHAELEAQRVEEIVQSIGSTEVHELAEPDDGFTARTRRSAAKARKSISLLQPGSSSKVNPLSSESATLEVVDNALRMVKRRRKQRHAKLRDMTREDEDASGLSGFRGGRGRWAGRGEGTLCPVCIKMVHGDPDVVEAHVDSCLAHAVRMQDAREREARERTARESSDGRDAWEEVEVDGETRIRVTDGVSFRGTGFDVRDRNQQDVDDEIDVDGEDEAVYGAAQFTEGDILASGSAQIDRVSPNEDEEVQIDGNTSDEEGAVRSVGHGESVRRMDDRTLRDLVAEGKLVKKDPASNGQDLKTTMDEVMGIGETDQVDRAIENARQTGQTAALVKALEDKVKLLESTRISSSTSLLCRICIDPYVEPTVSTGCWHTCCRECWLRCLGSTKLCPICKRITAAADLRRVYL